MEHLILLPNDELQLRLNRLRTAARRLCVTAGDPAPAALLISDNATIYYLTGRVFSGWAYVPLTDESDQEASSPVWFVRRPVEMQGENVVELRKPEEIPDKLAALHRAPVASIGLEMDILPYTTVLRLMKVFPSAKPFNASPVIALARSVKTPMEIGLMAQSGVIHEAVYSHIPALYSPGMNDFELEVAIENLARQEGCLGIFRISGQSMEFFMGNVLTGNNADMPTPYDFALGGAGKDPSLPVGACGEEIKPGSTVSVDVNGDYTGYMTDMTRVYSCGKISDKAMKAHQCSIDIHNEFRRMAVPGCAAADLYKMAFEKAKAAGLEPYFMGHRQHASFCGHGLGIEINEMPVISPRSKDILEEGNAIAFEPKFVIPGTGAVGIENTYIITSSAPRCLTNSPEEIISLL